MHSENLTMDAASAQEDSNSALVGAAGSQSSQGPGGGTGAATARRLADLILLKERIEALAPAIAKGISEKYEPVDDLNKLTFYLDAHFEDVWEMLHTPAHLLSRATEAEA